MIDQLNCQPLLIQLPIGSADTFKGVFDLVEMKSMIWKGSEMGAKFDILDSIPEGMEDMVAEYREKLVEDACAMDDEVMEAYLESGEAPSAEVLKRCIRKGTIASNLCRCSAAQLSRTRACSRS